MGGKKGQTRTCLLPWLETSATKKGELLIANSQPHSQKRTDFNTLRPPQRLEKRWRKPSFGWPTPFPHRLNFPTQQSFPFKKRHLNNSPQAAAPEREQGQPTRPSNLVQQPCAATLCEGSERTK